MKKTVWRDRKEFRVSATRGPTGSSRTANSATLRKRPRTYRRQTFRSSRAWFRSRFRVLRDRDRDRDPAPPPPPAAASAPRRRRLARRLPRAPRRVPPPTPRTAVPSFRKRFFVFATRFLEKAKSGSCVRSNRTEFRGFRVSCQTNAVRRRALRRALRRRALRRKKKLSSRRAPAATSRFRRGSPRTATRPRSRRAAESTGARRSRVPCADRASELVSERP